ncbi:hypothetical protein EG829_32565, partial [bacterium]|nr:hypothetical protein [bacterium]
MNEKTHMELFGPARGILMAFFLPLAICWVAVTLPAAAQQGSDPLMTLMQSQPRMQLDAPVVASAFFDPPAVRPNEKSVLRITLNAIEDTIEWPEELSSAPPELNLRRGAQGQILQMSGTNMEARTTFLYDAMPSAAGNYTVPSFRVNAMGKAVTVPETRLLVRSDLAPNAPRAQKLILEMPGTNFYAGQAVRPRVLLPFAYGHMQTLSQVRINGQGFLSDPNALRQRIEPMVHFGSNMITFIHEPLLTPISVGT